MQRNGIKVVEYLIRSGKVSDDFLGYRLAVISDLHNCVVGSAKWALSDAVALQKPDAILLAGDMITQVKRSGTVQKERALAELRQLAAIAPVYYGMGNHEQRWKELDPPGSHAFEDYCRELEGLGMTLLDNRSVDLIRGESKIRVTGLALPNRFYNKRKIVRLQEEEITQLVGAPEEGCYQILLAHTPQFYAAYRRWGADMALAGHYHGGVIRLPILGGVISTNFRPFPRYDHGRYSEEGKEMIVTSGLGCHTIPIRVNNPPEIAVLTFVGD